MIVELKIVQSVPAGTIVSVSYAPPEGKNFAVQGFFAECAVGALYTVSLTWKFEHDTEEEDFVWKMKNSGKMPFTKEFEDADGIRKIGISLENASLSPINLSGYAIIEVND